MSMRRGYQISSPIMTTPTTSQATRPIEIIDSKLIVTLLPVDKSFCGFCTLSASNNKVVVRFCSNDRA